MLVDLPAQVVSAVDARVLHERNWPEGGGEQMEDLPLAPPKCWWTCPRKSSGQGTGGIADATTAPEEPVAPPTANDPTDAPKPEAAPSPLPARTATEPMSASQD